MITTHEPMMMILLFLFLCLNFCWFPRCTINLFTASIHTYRIFNLFISPGLDKGFKPPLAFTLCDIRWPMEQ